MSAVLALDGSMRGRLPTSEAIRAFALAGNAYLTIRSARTGQRFTYRVSKPEDDGSGRQPIWFVSVLSGQNNEGDYRYLGFVRAGAYVHGGRKAKVGADAPSAVAFAWLWRGVSGGASLPAALEVWHEGCCGRCGRKLTVPESVASGFGPECTKIMGGA